MRNLKQPFAAWIQGPLGTPRRVGERAFTMVEVALSIAIVAFAMVAIIGVLPTGFQVQRDNREETIVNQDGTYLLEAIRGGALELDELTNFVERITISNSLNPRNPLVGSRLPVTGNEIPLANAHFIVGMLSVPTFQEVGEDRSGPLIQVNEVTALMRSISGNAAQRLQDRRFRENAFTYLVTTTIAPYVPLVINVPFRDPRITTNRHDAARHTMNNLYDLRLHFRWPVNETGQGRNVGYQVGNKEKVFRTLVSGRLLQTNSRPFFPANALSMNDWRTNLFHFQPSTFTRPFTNSLPVR